VSNAVDPIEVSVVANAIAWAWAAPSDEAEVVEIPVSLIPTYEAAARRAIEHLDKYRSRQ
jgi:hypothetical protein